jgi:mercuric ion binding protein
MKRILVTISALTILAISGVSALALMPGQQGDNNTSAQVIAEEKTANFNVENMTCAMCPITVRKAMEQVNGVKSVVVDYDTKIATVVFDPAIATPVQIGSASANAGYPATPAS